MHGERLETMLTRKGDRMMTAAQLLRTGVKVVFADGRQGFIPFMAIPEVGGLTDLASLELPNPYEVVLRHKDGEAVELPWDFARHYCDGSYRPRVEAVGTAGRASPGRRVRTLREATGMTQDELAKDAGISGVTLVRIEQGEQSLRHDTLSGLADALGKPAGDLLAARVER